MPGDPRSIVPLFVVGMPRSGTTWVGEILASSQGTGLIRESYMLSARGGLGALLGGVDRGHESRGGPAGLGRLFTRSELVAEVRELAERWLGREAPPDARFVVEKSPWHLRDAPLIAEVLPAARFVNVVRDGRDVAVSLRAARRSWARARDPRAVRSIDAMARLWVEAVALARDGRSHIGERFLEVRFEDLKADPSTEIRRLYRSCGIDHDDALVERVVRETSFEGRHEGGEGAFYRGGRVGDWRGDFSLRDARSFHRVAWPALRDTGYESDRRWWLRQAVRSGRRSALPARG